MALKTLTLLLATISVAVAALWLDCPEPEEMTLCSCRWLLASFISCNQIKSRNDLQSNIEVLKGYGVKELTLSEVSALTVPEGLFEGLHVKQLILNNFEIRDSPFPLGSTPFSGLEKSLEELEVKNSFKKEKALTNLKLDHLQKLRIATFQDSSIPTIGNDCFANGSKTVQMLLFEMCDIKELGDKVFQSLDNLMFITVSGNEISQVSRSMFPSPARHLHKMDIQYNKISNLPSDLFSDMPSLTEINFSDNNIHVLPEGTWSDILLKVARLYFDGNPLQCDDGLKWICNSRVDVVVAKCVTPSGKKGDTVRQFCKK